MYPRTTHSIASGSAPDSDDVIQEISPESLEEMMPSLSSGMVPKMTACLEAVRGGARPGPPDPRTSSALYGLAEHRRRLASASAEAPRPNTGTSSAIGATVAAGGGSSTDGIDGSAPSARNTW